MSIDRANTLARIEIDRRRSGHASHLQAFNASQRRPPASNDELEARVEVLEAIVFQLSSRIDDVETPRPTT